MTALTPLPLVVFSLCLGLAVCQVDPSTTTSAPVSKKNYLYNGTDVLLELTRKLPMTLMVNGITTVNEVHKVGPVLGSIDFPEAAKATVTGSKKDGKDSSVFTLSLSYSNPIPGSNIDVTNVTLDFEITLDNRIEYWNISSLEISLVGKLKSNCTTSCDVNLKNFLDVAPKRGYTVNPVDLNCQRDYTICAPVNLCWTCNDQYITTKLNQTAVPVPSMVPSILIPGMRLQPLSTNGTKNFGYRWDCDPIWSSALWFSLLLSLFLIVILAWGIDMLVTLQTPSKFDDPKGKPLVVPLTE